MKQLNYFILGFTSALILLFTAEKNAPELFNMWLFSEDFYDAIANNHKLYEVIQLIVIFLFAVAFTNIIISLSPKKKDNDDNDTLPPLANPV